MNRLEDRVVPTWSVSNASALAMAQSLVGAGVTVSNVTYKGATAAAGTFTETANTVGFSKGVILSSGSAAGIAGPNSSGSQSTSNNTAGDAQLSALANITGRDAAVLEFDWVPTGSVVVFSYAFGSEEYPEYAPPNGSSYSDAFAFFLNGKNVTFIPGTTTSVAIKNINAVTNTKYYVNNGNGSHDTQMDGYTTVLTAVMIVKPGTTNHVKLVIQDASDTLYDSWVVIKAGALSSAQIGTRAPLRYAYNPITKIYSGAFSIANNSSTSLPGPLFVVFDSIPKGVAIQGVSISPSGQKYIKLPGSLPAGSSYFFTLKIYNPYHVRLGSIFINSFKFSLTNLLT